MNNAASQYLYKKLYNKGDFLKLIINPAKIKAINQYYKNNFEKSNDLNDFLQSMGNLGESLKLSKAAVCEVNKQFHKRLGLQPAILTECFMVQTIANFFALDYFIDVDEKEENIPSFSLKLRLFTFKGAAAGPVLPRYIYHNEGKDIILLQYGDSLSADAVFLKNKKIVRIEFKQENAKLSEFDITGYDENGFLSINDKFKENYEDYVDLINEFNNQTTVFDYIGHNFKLEKYLHQEKVLSILDSNFKLKDINLYILQEKDKIYPVLPEDLFTNISVSGSEIRTAGRNPAKVFTPIYAENILQKRGGKIGKNGKVEIPLKNVTPTIGRNVSKVTRYKINNLLFVKNNKVEIKDDTVFFHLKDLRQLKPTIAIHIHAKINKEILNKSYA